MRYRSIDRRRYLYPVRMMCRLLKVSRSGYYAWRKRPPSARDKTDRRLTGAICRIHRESKGTYGSPRIRAELKSQGLDYGRHKVARLMRLAGLTGCPKRRYKVTTQSDPSHPVAANLIKQNFTAESISPIFRHSRVGYIWLWSWICIHAELWAGRWIDGTPGTW
jgi:hypothetical protein